MQNFTNLQKALVEIGVAQDEFSSIVFDRNNYLKIDHGKFKTDFLPSLTGLDDYRASEVNARVIDFEGEKIAIISYEDLVKNKQSIKRTVDQEDL